MTTIRRVCSLALVSTVAGLAIASPVGAHKSHKAGSSCSHPYKFVYKEPLKYIGDQKHIHFTLEVIEANSHGSKIMVKVRPAKNVAICKVVATNQKAPGWTSTKPGGVKRITKFPQHGGVVKVVVTAKAA